MWIFPKVIEKNAEVFFPPLKYVTGTKMISLKCASFCYPAQTFENKPGLPLISPCIL